MTADAMAGIATQTAMKNTAIMAANDHAVPVQKGGRGTRPLGRTLCTSSTREAIR